MFLPESPAIVIQTVAAPVAAMVRLTHGQVLEIRITLIHHKGIHCYIG